jgi:pilus assembly protein CpaE
MTMASLSAALVIADPTLHQQALDCIAGLPVRSVSDQPSLEDMEDFLDRIERFRADVILLEWSLLRVPLDDFIRRLKVTASEPAVFILQTQAVPENILEAMQAGASEYLCPPLGGALKEAFERLSIVRVEQISHHQKKLGRLFGFISAKGGCGATTFASHVATTAARLTEKPLLLADLDFEAGLLRFMLKAKPPYTLRDALDNMHRMDSNYWNALVTRHGKHLDFIAAPEELGDRNSADPKQLGRLLRFIRMTYPAAVLDFGRCYSPAAIDMLPEMEALYLVVTDDLLVLENARELIRTAEERTRSTERIRVILNKVGGRQKPDLDNLGSFLGLRPEAIFSDDREALYETWSEGRLLGDDSAFGRQLAALAKSMMFPETAQLSGKQNGKRARIGDAKSANPAAAQASGFGRFFSFMRSSRA